MHDRVGFSIATVFVPILPFCLSVVAAVLGNVPITFLGGWVPPPLLAFMPVYFWCLVRPDLMPPPAALGLGAFQDLLSGGHMGIWAVSFVVAYAVVDRERDGFAGLAGLGAILGFAAAMLVVEFVAYLVAAVSYQRLPSLEPLLAMGAVSVLAYLPILGLLNLIHHRLIGPLRSDF